MSGSSPPPADPADSAVPPRNALLLAMDTASPTVSVAVGRDGVCLAARSVELRRSSEALLRLVDEALREAGVALGELEGIVALRGPGSFTGLRVGLATTLGLHQALGTPATAVPTLEVLGVAARAVRPEADGPVAAVVDALRGQWFTRIFGRSGAGAASETGTGTEAAILDPADIAAHRPTVLVGHGAERLAAEAVWGDGSASEAEPARPVVLDLAAADWPGPSLAEAALLHHARRSDVGPGDVEEPGPVRPWDPTTLTHPLYLRAPAVTLPKRSPQRARPEPKPERDPEPVAADAAPDRPAPHSRNRR